MSQIESIYSPQVEKQLQTIYSELEKHQKKVLELSKMSVDFYGGKTASSPKDLGKVANDMAKIEKQAERNRLAEIKLMQAREKAFDRFEKTYQKEQMQLKASENLYNKVQAKLNSLQNSYKGLATKKELGIKLTTNEEKKYISLQNKIQKYDTTLKAVDGTMGKNQRNVGNYASAFNPLTNSITQLSREMPAFANSFQTGFMAISNNLPIFFDAMQQVIVKTKALQAEGKPTKSVLSQLATSFFSVQTLLSVGVTLLTIYGDELLDMVLNTKEAKKATEEHTKALEHKEQVERNYTEAIRDNASEEITRSKLLFENAKNVNLSMKDRLKAINDLRERYPDYLKNLTDQEILAGNTADAETRLNEALIKRGIALAIQDKIKEKYKELTDQIIELEKTQNSLNIVENENDKAREKKNKLLKESKNINDLLSKTEKEDLFIKRELVTSEKILNKEKEETSKKTNKIKSEIQTLLDIYNKYSSFLDIVNEGQKNNNNLRDEEIKKIKEITGLKIEENKAIDVNLESIESQIENYERLKKAREDDAEALKKWSEEYRKGFQDDFISNSGFDKIFFII